ncbi:MAG: molybdopterin-dependent oxidoreductase [Clostridiales bacterium]|nr:molybdopterin-dependent oxidoreductase [Clostridiales bacterium]
MYNYVGKSLPRQDGYDKVTGAGVFTHDVRLPDMLHAKVLRSPHAHARILSIDTSEALALEGVRAVVTWENSPRVLFNASDAHTGTMPPNKPVLDQYVFDNVVRYVGDEVAAVAALTPGLAEKACGLIKVEYEVLPAVFDPLEAMEEGAPDVHKTELKNTPVPPFQIAIGNFQEAYESSEYKVDVSMKVPVQKHAQLETNAAVADYRDGRLTVYSTTQSVHPTKQILALIMGMPESKVRVLNPPYVGGAFGVRCGLSAKAEPIAAILSRMANKPVRCVYDREEDFIASDSRHSGYLQAKLGADKDGVFQALEIRGVLNKGAYTSFGVEVVGVMCAMSLAIYRVPNVACHGRTVYTNVQAGGAMRGFGNPQGTAVVEMAVDAMAKKLNMDPKEIRLKNILEAGDPWCLPFMNSSTALAECIEKAAERIKWSEKRNAFKAGKIRRGVGLAVGNHVSNAWPFCVDFDSVYLRLEADGSLQLATGVPDIGQGSGTTLMQVAAEALGSEFETVAITFSDTETTPFDVGSHASRTLYAVGICILEAAKDLKRQVLEYTAAMWGARAEDLTLERGVIRGAGGETPLRELCREAHLLSKEFIAVGRTTPPNAPSWHAHAAEVEVDTETGMVRVVKYVAAHDCGTAVNPQIVEGQIEGGVAMGIGYALREEIVRDEEGVPYNNGYHKYMLATAGDMPEIEAIIVECSDGSGPFGAKGVGESAMVPSAPAILAAVEDAVGVRYGEMPLTPERVLNGLR